MSNDIIYLRPLDLGDAENLTALRLRNREFFQPFEPVREALHYTLEGQLQEIESAVRAAENDQSFTFGVFRRETDEIAGRIALTGIARGPFQNANLGYYIDRQYNGKGFATAAVSLCLEFAFQQAGLHRVQAGVMPRNLPSVRVLEKAGFRYEGIAKRYLKINGAWEDHLLYAVTSEDRM